jgi:hypothetical protein
MPFPILPIRKVKTMKKFIFVSVAAIVACVTAVHARDAVPGDAIIQLAATPRLLDASTANHESEIGCWEYVYDVIATVDDSATGDNRNHSWLKYAGISGFDSSLIVNMWNASTGEQWDGTQTDPENYKPLQNWTANSAGTGTMYNGYLYPDRWPSYWRTNQFFQQEWMDSSHINDYGNTDWTTTYDRPNLAWAIENTWHGGNDYTGTSELLFTGASAGGYVAEYVGPGPDGIEGTEDDIYEDVWVANGVTYTNNNGNLSYARTEGLATTFRIVHPGAPADVTWWTYNNFPGAMGWVTVDPDGVPDSGDEYDEWKYIEGLYEGNPEGTILGPGPVLNGRLGDFDGDGDIDADDIDALGAAIQAGSTDTEFDMDGDGDVDADDFNMHVTTLVDTALGEGTGTAFGDFNLDGLVGILDLGLLGDGYNSTNGWANGDANGDGTIGILDLGLLGDNYGYDGSAIPEPATMSLLGLGAVALLRRRSR